VHPISERRDEIVGKVGLALGAGSARGWAHIGVIRALTEAGIRVDFVAGTSIGALVGVVYASGKIDELEALVLQLEWKQLLSFVDAILPKSGLVDGVKITNLVRLYVHGGLIEDLPLPFSAVATDLHMGREVVLRDGDIIEAVRASISLPGIFTPVRRNGTILVDGGLVNPLPVRTARSMGADFVIAVDLNSDTVPGRRPRETSGNCYVPTSSIRHYGLRTGSANKIAAFLNEQIHAIDLPVARQIKRWMDKESLPSIFGVLMTSVKIMQAQITTANLQADPADLLIQPKLGHINFVQFDRAGEAIAEGYRATKVALAEWRRRGVIGLIAFLGCGLVI